MTDHIEARTAPASPRPDCSRTVTAVLGPTNTGKTHLAIERMLGHETGLIGLPLRLLAREVYDKIAARMGAQNVALITGEEKIKPDNPRYYVCTVEAMPREISVDFLAIDEIQLAADPERGHVFTDRLFHARGTSETLLLGAATMQGAIRDLLPDANFIARPRLSKLAYAGQKKISRLPRRTAIVAFSANDVYAIAELIRRQRGGAAVVLGALSPRTRNAQVALYQSGDVDFLVATDAIGMGLNLDVDHVAFAGAQKFDGHTHRALTPVETGQIAGRAGRHMNDGTFGVTADVAPFPPELVTRLEEHDFEPVKILQWRNPHLDFHSLDRLRQSLRLAPNSPRLSRARQSEDVSALETLAKDAAICDIACAPAAVARLWEVCQIPDYRKISSASHADLVANLYKFLMGDAGVIPEDWFASQVAHAASTEGDIDTLASRIAQIRTWTFVSNRHDWLADPQHWQERTREIEDSLSDALHEQITQRFVDRRTSVLMKRLHDKASLYAEIGKDGRIHVEKHYVGRLDGFRFTPDTHDTSAEGRAARGAAAQVLTQEIAARAAKLVDDAPDAFALTRTGVILWRGEIVARLEGGDDPLKPAITLLADEHMGAPDRERVLKRLQTWLSYHIGQRIKPLVDLAATTEIGGLGRGIAFRLVENFGVLKREPVAEEIRQLDQTVRAQLRKYGVRFGAYSIFFPALLKPDAAELLLLLWALKHGGEFGMEAATLPEPPRAGLTSVVADPAQPEAFYRAAGFQVCGERAVRVDILERLGDRIRPLIAWKPSEAVPEPPAGALGNGAFKVEPGMMSFLGCSAEELSGVLRVLGFRMERRLLKTAPVKDEGTPSAADAPAGGGNAAPAEQNPAEPAAEAPENAASAKAEPASEEDGTTAADMAADAAGDAAAEPDYEEIWRPARRQQSQARRGPKKQSGAHRGAQSRTAAADAAGARARSTDHHAKTARGKQGEGEHESQQRRRGAAPSAAKNSARLGKRQPQRVDPDSPFAALQGLKEQLERRSAQERG